MIFYPRVSKISVCSEKKSDVDGWIFYVLRQLEHYYLMLSPGNVNKGQISIKFQKTQINQECIT